MVHSGRNTFPKAQQYEKSFNVSSTANIALPDLIERTEQFALQLFQVNSINKYFTTKSSE